MNQCQYSFARAGPPLGSAESLLITLHAKDENLSDLAPLLALADSGLAVYGVESNRPARILPRADKAWKADDIGRIWFLEHETGNIEPATFGDALAQLELFLIDAIKNETGASDNVPRVFLYGTGQGATLALTLLTLHPDHIDGIISVDGQLPLIPGAFENRPMLSKRVRVSLNFNHSMFGIPDNRRDATIEAFRQSACRLELNYLEGTGRPSLDRIRILIGQWQREN